MADLTPLSPEAWSPEKARHLLNRAGFGLTQARAARLASLTHEAAVNELVDYDTIPVDFPEPDFLIEPLPRRLLVRKLEEEGLDSNQIHLRIQAQQQEERRAITELQGWWLDRMYRSPRPLEEKMTLFWHGHFAVSSQKVRQSQVTYDMNAMLRRNATGNFKALTTAVGQSPAMLEYLDNRKSTKNEPNENWARELMELFTLGKGNYTEQDIKESARAFTGWTCTYKDFTYDPRRHDFGQKTFMGRTGDFEGWQIIDIIFEQPAVASFISRKLWAFFAQEDPAPEIVDALAKVFRENNYEIKPLLKAMFRADAFYAPQVMGSQIKSPAQFLLQLCDDLGVETLPRRALAQGCRQLGQDLFYPPNVKGWDGNRAWINANTLLLRYNAPPLILVASTKESAPESTMMQSADADPTMQQEAAPAPDMQAEAGMQMQPAADAKPATADQRMAAWRKEAMAQAKEKLKTLPAAERKAKLQAFREAGPREKMAMLRDLGIEPPTDLFKGDALGFFDTLTFKTGTECLAAVEKRLLSAPLDAQQRSALLAAIGVSDPAAPLAPSTLDIDARRTLLRLVSSTPQYQLC